MGARSARQAASQHDGNKQDGFLTETREVLRADLETADWNTVDDIVAKSFRSTIDLIAYTQSLLASLSPRNIGA